MVYIISMLTVAFHTKHSSVQLLYKREQLWRGRGPIEQQGWDGKVPGLDGSKLWRGRSCGLTSGGQSHTASSSSSIKFLVPSSRGPLSTYWVAAQKLWGKANTSGDIDQVLKTIAESICSAIATCQRSKPMKQTISFIRAGEKPRTTSKGTSGLLYTAQEQAADSGPRQATQVPPPCRPYHPQTWHHSGVRGIKECCHAGAHCAMRSADGGGLWTEEGEVPGPSQRLLQTRLEGKVLACGGRVQRLCWTVPLQSLHCTWHHRWNVEEDHL